ncbi:hypothetical protein, partial [Acinetobacter baumannii]|uniref:hypothetical protein n=1 Tax=Acinetobacter baumannii TaxID=470 RepID=UPI0025A66BEB
PKNDFTLKVPTMEGIHLLYLEINKIFSLSCQPICNSALYTSYTQRESGYAGAARQIGNTCITEKRCAGDAALAAG